MREGSWCKPEKKRACEYDAIYWWLKQSAVKQTALRSEPVDVVGAAKLTQEEMDIGGKSRKGKMTIYQFMNFCREERGEWQEQQKAEKAAEADDGQDAGASED